MNKYKFRFFDILLLIIIIITIIIIIIIIIINNNVTTCRWDLTVSWTYPQLMSDTWPGREMRCDDAPLLKVCEL